MKLTPGEQCPSLADGIEVNEYLIKWQGFSHLHNTWELAQDMLGSREAAMSLGLSVLPRTAREQGTPVKGYKRMENYIRRRQVQERSLAALSAEELEQARIDEEMERHLLREHCRVERVVSVRTDDLGEPEYFCKWRGLPYAECTWEAAALVAKDFAAEIADFEQRYRSLRVPSRCACSPCPSLCLPSPSTSPFLGPPPPSSSFSDPDPARGSPISPGASPLCLFLCACVCVSLSRSLPSLAIGHPHHTGPNPSATSAWSSPRSPSSQATLLAVSSATTRSWV